MRFIFLLLLFFILEISFAQNLVPNPSFEEYKILPCSINQYFIQETLQEWIQPIPTSSDYWRSDIPTNCYLNPLRINKQPRTGNGMVGLIVASLAFGSRYSYMEYAEVKLNKPLEKGKFYCGEFYTLNRNRNSSEGNFLIDILESNNLGIYFSNEEIFIPVSPGQPSSLQRKEDILIKSVDIIPADDNWHRIEGCFEAKKEFLYLTFGNFDSIDSTTINQLTSIGELASAYYFIDDVSLIEMPYAPPALANEITFCHTESHVLLDATSEGATGYTWIDGSTSPTLLVNNRFTDTYTVSIAYGNYTYKHKFKVTYIPDVELGTDTLLCDSESILLQVNHALQNFQWNDLSTANEKIITSPGQYWVNFDSTCPVRDTLTVSYIKCPGFIPNIITPNGDDKNEKFTIENISNRNWSLQVFNRWGNKVYEQAHYTNNWQGENQNPGIYYYVLYCESLNRRVKGWLHILH